LSSFLPFSLSATGIFMVLAALGAIAGLFFFFHGFSRLQESRLSPAGVIAKSPVRPPAMLATKSADPVKRNSHEVIQLSSVETQVNGSESMTQQGKIAAALLRAGIPNPVTWADQRVPNEVHVEDEPESERETGTNDVSRVLQQKSNAPALQLPTRDQNPTADRMTSLMIWGGPALTLACIYILAAHFGWL
jgi:hypothetical protein